MAKNKFSLFWSRVSVESDRFEALKLKSSTGDQFHGSGMCSKILTYQFHSAKRQAPLHFVST